MLQTLLFASLGMAHLALPGPASAAETPPLDLAHAVVVSPPRLSSQEETAVRMLVEEAEKRTGLRWARATTWPGDDTPAIAIGPLDRIRRLDSRLRAFLKDAQPARAEGFHLRTLAGRPAPAVVVAGNDARGVLFGAGKLLRSLELSKGSAILREPLNIDSAPKYALRGHQLGYRPKTNSYDAWDLPQWEQYIRDLAVFGANAVELIPPRSDDAADSPHFPRPPMEIMVGMSKLLDRYGMDVWVWYPAMDPDYANPATVERALAEWGEVFSKLPRIDAVYVPGGDPGHTQPRVLFALLEKQAANLHRYHPRAQIWVSPQGFTRQWFAEFLELMKRQPKWLTGIVFGPQVRMPLPELRKAIPARYPIRHYPDITHNVYCQYPVPDWDPAFCLTELRENVNPRPLDQAAIFRLLQPYTIGFLTYSEGCNDDANKAVWSGLGWDPDQDVKTILRDYSRYFIGPKYERSFSDGLLALERNWRGPAIANQGIDATLRSFQALEKDAAPRDRRNWRFQQALYRAYYDAYVRAKARWELALEQEALGALRDARRTGSGPAMSDAEASLARSAEIGPGRELRARVFELGEALFQSIGMQLSVPRHQAISVDRGANLDTIDLPLNSRAWLRKQLEEIRGLGSEPERLARIDRIVHWQDPGSGGFYDAPGDPSLRPHLLPGTPWSEDPAGYHGVTSITDDEAPVSPRQQWRHALTFYGEPLRLRYAVDPRTRYRLRVVYGDGPVRLALDDRTEIHGLITKPYQFLEFDLPDDAAASGTLELVWRGDENRGGAGRGCQVAEVWLIKKPRGSDK